MLARGRGGAGEAGPCLAWLPYSRYSPGWKVLQSEASETSEPHGAYSLLTRAMSGEELGLPWIRLWRKCGSFWMSITHPKYMWCASLDWISWLIPISLEKAGATQWLGNGRDYRSGNDANVLLPTLSEFKISLSTPTEQTPQMESVQITCVCGDSPRAF